MHLLKDENGNVIPHGDGLPINMSMTMTMDVKNMHATDAVAVLTNVRTNL